MTTALRRLTNRLTEALSLKVVEGEATQALFAELDTEIDTAVVALESAANAREMEAAEQTYGHVFKAFASDGANFAKEFLSVARVFDRAEAALAAPAPAADFHAFDSTLRATAHDFRHFGADMGLLGSLHSPKGLGEAVTKSAGVTTALWADFSTLSGEAKTLVADLPPANAALGAAMAPLADEFSALATDFANFSTLLGGHPGSVPASTTPLTFDGVFASLDMHFIALDNTLQGAGAPIAQLLLGAKPHCA